MKGTLRQVVGIDVAKDELVACLSKIDKHYNVETISSAAFKNTVAGFKKLLEWTKKSAEKNVNVRFVMEATGVYHESFAYFLDEAEQDLSIVLPNKISNYARTLDIKTVTDKTSSQAIARFGLERKLESWHRPDPVFVQLRKLTREREHIVDDKASLKNQLHAEKHSAVSNPRTISRITMRIELIKQQEAEIMKEIKALVSKNKKLKERIDRAMTIPGVGWITAVTAFAETNGFDLIKNKRQLASYAGFDVREKTSGTSVNLKPRISKQGNKHLRKSMHMPSLQAKKRIPAFATIYDRLLGKHGIKMKALVAVQRRLLELIYTLDHKKQPYDKNYGKATATKRKQMSTVAAHA